MKNIKRLFAALLTVALVSVNATSFAYYTGKTEAEESAYSEKYVMAEKTLYGLGVLPELSTDSYEDGMSRAEFAAAVSVLGGGKTVLADEPAEEVISIGEAVKMLVEMSENTIRAEHEGSYPDGYLKVARDMGITYGIAGMQEYDKLTYGMAVQILYNSMRVTPGVINEYTANGSNYKFDSNRTVLTEYMDVTIKTGFVTADNFWSLNPETPVGTENVLVINGQSYKVKNPIDDDYVGYAVNFYYSNEEDVILAIEKTKKAEQVLLDGANILGFSSNSYLYDVNGKTEKFKLDENVYIVNNFEAVIDENVNMTPDNSDVVLVDSDGNGRYETVFIKTYEEIAVQSLDEKSFKLASKDGDSYNLSEDKPARVYLNGEASDYAKVDSKKHASIVVDSNDVVREIYLSSDKVSGTVTGYDAGEKVSFATIDGVEYVVADNAINKSSLKAGVSGEFKLNFKGEIASVALGAGTSSANTEEIGYIITMRFSEVQDTFKVKLLNEKGKVVELVTADRCRVNGTRLERTLPTDLKDGGLDRAKQQVITYTLNDDGKITRINTPVPEAQVNDGDYKLHKTLSGNYAAAAYSLDNRILTNEDTITFQVPSSYSEEEYNFKKGGLSGYGPHVVDIYSFEKNSPIANVVICKSDVGSSARVGVMGGAGVKVDTQYDDKYVVLNATKEYNEDYGIVVDVIEVYNLKSGQKSKKLLADNASWTAFKEGSSETKVVSYAEGYGAPESETINDAPGDLKPGDFFCFTENNLGEIGTIYKIYDASDRTLVKGTMPNNTTFDFSDRNNWNSSFYTGSMALDGYVVKADKDYVGIVDYDAVAAPGFTMSSLTRDNLKLFKYWDDNQSKAYTVRIEGNKVEVTNVAFADIVPGIRADRHCFIWTYWGYPQKVMIYDYEG